MFKRGVLKLLLLLFSFQNNSTVSFVNDQYNISFKTRKNIKGEN